MAAIELTEIMRNEQHLVLALIKAEVTTQGDWVVLDDVKGVFPIAGIAQSIAASGEETLTWGVARIDNGGAAYDATTTSIVCDECTAVRTGKPFYLITAGGEIMEVLTDATPATAVGTFTVKRGCLGTTASATGLANNNYMGIMNILFLGTNLVGPHIIVALPLPNDPRYT